MYVCIYDRADYLLLGKREATADPMQVQPASCTHTHTHSIYKFVRADCHMMHTLHALPLSAQLLAAGYSYVGRHGVAT